jgi:hypothetical protein
MSKIKPLQKGQLSIEIKTAHTFAVLSTQTFNTQFWHEVTKNCFMLKKL